MRSVGILPVDRCASMLNILWEALTVKLISFLKIKIDYQGGLLKFASFRVYHSRFVKKWKFKKCRWLLSSKGGSMKNDHCWSVNVDLELMHLINLKHLLNSNVKFNQPFLQ